MSEILLKRGARASLPTLKPGEAAWTTDTKELFIGSDAGNIQLSTKNGVSVKHYNEYGTFAVDSNTITITNPIYDDGDDIELYIGGIRKTKGVDYNVNNTIITKVGDPWEANYTYDVVIIKNVAALDPDEPWIDGGTF